MTTGATVDTVLGPVAVDTLGRTLMHEHVFTLYGDLRLQSDWDEEAMVALAVERLVELRAAGFDTIVDMTVWGLGRSVPRIARIARESGVAIIAATGVYTFSDLPGFFRGQRTWIDEDVVSKLMIEEVEHGIAGTGIRAAVLKCVTNHQGVTEDVAYLIRQTALAQLRTGRPISTHSHAPSRQGLEQQRILRDSGVDLGRVIIGHSGDSTDLDYLEALIGNGSYLGMDKFGHAPSGDLQSKIDTVVALCERGYADRMVLSHDTNVATDNTPASVRENAEFRDWRYTCIPQLVLPALRERGVSDADIDTMTIHTPARILA